MAAPLSELTTLRLGGPPRRLIEIEAEEQLVATARAADRGGEPLLVLAGGSNVVVADEGFPGTVALVRTRGVEQREADADRVRLEVAAGEDWDALVARCVAGGLTGFECLSGIPGSTGATPIQNVGAYGQDVSETIVAVRVYDRARDRIELLGPEACGFSYRSSVFKRRPDRWVVLSVAFELERSELSAPIRYPELGGELGAALGERAPLAEVRQAVLALRRRKGMVIDPGDPDTASAGSFFTNPVLGADDFARVERTSVDRLGEGAVPPRFDEPDGRVKTSAAWLIERAGFGRGHGDPDTVAISSKHSLALTNRGAGTTAALLALAREIAAGVVEAFGVELVPEPVLVGQSWAPPVPRAAATVVPERVAPD